jgi:SAM-dependent methyltransferase
MIGSFVCNVCSAQCAGGEFDRETPSCPSCGSNVRIRALMRALSLELFGTTLRLDEFPVLKSVRGLGLSDSESYADRLRQKFDYVNTYYHQEPRVDISELLREDRGAFDFVTSSEVFEHVSSPVESALEHVYRVLKPHGKLIMTVPYVPEGDTIEHFENLEDYTLTVLGGEPVLVGRTNTGELTASRSLLFHGGQGSTLEMRQFSATGLRNSLLAAGFCEIVFHADDWPEYGIRHAESWSLPLAARKETTPAVEALIRELVEQYRLANELADKRLLSQSNLEQNLEACTKWAVSLDADVLARTEWARSLESDLSQAAATIENLQRELEERTKWALSLDAQFQERTAWALQLQKEVSDLQAERARQQSTLSYRVTQRLAKLLRSGRA